MLRQFITAIGLAAAAALAHAGEAGRIVFVTGDAQIAARPVALNDAVQEGDELVTGADGYLYLKTVDNGFLILRPRSRARVVTYHVDAQNPANTRVKLELLQGVARAISGQAVKQARQNFRFNTPVAAIGVRGTDFTVFTDQQTSRVAVISGGVVVSGFSAGCGPEGGGPCEGTSSRELFADQAGQMLQVQRGQAAPQLLRSNGLAPDVAAPPRKDEPVGKPGAAEAPIAAADLDAHKVDVVTKNLPTQPPTSSPSTPPPTPDSQLPPVGQKPQPDMPKLPEIIWGRWASIADLPPDPKLRAELDSGKYDKLTRSNDWFSITRLNNTEFTMPNEGRAEFRLTDSEAYIHQPGQTPLKASVENGKFAVDFGAGTFTTSLTVVEGDTHVNVSAKGGMTSKGAFESSLMGSNAKVVGYLGGAGAKEAGYIFNTNGNTGPQAFGATKWAR